MRDAAPFYEAIGHEIEIFERAWRHGLSVLLRGPIGCGKTRFVQYMARRLELPLYSVACHDGLGAADLLGRHLVGADGIWWQDGPLTRAVREGGICYLDEVVEARQDTTVATHSLADGRRELYLERTGKTLQVPPSFMLVVSYNPGYQNLPKGLKPSTRQRFVVLRSNYPTTQQEAHILVDESGCVEALAQRLVQLGQALRRLEQHDLGKVASTHLLIFVTRLVGDDMDPRGVCRVVLAESLLDDPVTVVALMDIADLHVA